MTPLLRSCPSFVIDCSMSERSPIGTVKGATKSFAAVIAIDS